MKNVLYNLTLISALITASFFTGCKKDDGYGSNPFNPVDVVNAMIKSEAGDIAAIVPKLKEFRVLVGDPLNALFATPKEEY